MKNDPEPDRDGSNEVPVWKITYTQVYLFYFFPPANWHVLGRRERKKVSPRQTRDLVSTPVRFSITLEHQMKKKMSLGGFCWQYQNFGWTFCGKSSEVPSLQIDSLVGQFGILPKGPNVRWTSPASEKNAWARQKRKTASLKASEHGEKVCLAKGVSSFWWDGEATLFNS